jgi:uncharacterized protein (DUF1684 family)
MVNCKTRQNTALSFGEGWGEAMKLHKYILYTILAVALQLPVLAMGQTYKDSIAKYRQQYIAELLKEPRKPIQQGDERYLRFFDVNTTYKVVADFELTPGSTPFLIATHSGKNKPFREYGKFTFTIHDTTFTLHAYQNLDLVNDKNHKEDLFIPFTDITNYSSTFAGGRYIDLSVSDIKNNQVLLDFNKCYNPYCAYGEGFSCPIPPSENFINIAIKAGEKMYAKHMAE